jgi:hypothetical protein
VHFGGDEVNQSAPILYHHDGGDVSFKCPGCGYAHTVYLGVGEGPRWSYNGNPEKPTFAPSILVRGIRLDMTDAEHAAYDLAFEKCGYTSAILNDPRFASVCHSFVTDGRIQFLSDCTHALAGQTVDLPPWKS